MNKNGLDKNWLIGQVSVTVAKWGGRTREEQMVHTL